MKNDFDKLPFESSKKDRRISRLIKIISIIVTLFAGGGMTIFSCGDRIAMVYAAPEEIDTLRARQDSIKSRIKYIEFDVKVNKYLQMDGRTLEDVKEAEANALYEMYQKKRELP